MLNIYFENKRYQDALNSSALFARKRDWRMSYRAELYEYAQDAFDLELPLEQRQAAFMKIYSGLERYYGVFRNSTGGPYSLFQNSAE